MRKCAARIVSAAILILLCSSLFGCGKAGPSMKDGYYTAQASDYSHGWKEFVTVTVKNGAIVTVEYNAENSSGFIKSWDNAYMKNMNAVDGTYPNEYTRNYAAQLLSGQSPEQVDAISGATTSYGSFKLIAQAVIDQAIKGDSSIAVVDTTAAQATP